nr:hypothetical protein GCM10017745_55170 [Saccharothrix mutabilis subsp. capreolus]
MRQRVVRADRVQHQRFQLGLARHVGVERRRADAQVLRDPAHRQRGQAVRLDHLDRGPHDPLQREAPLRTARRAAAVEPQQFEGAVGVHGETQYTVRSGSNAVRSFTWGF